MLGRYTFVAIGFVIGLGIAAASNSEAFPALMAGQSVPPEAMAASAQNMGRIVLAQSNQGERRRERRDRMRGSDLNFSIDGPRCRYRTGECRYYRDGYYYRSPWRRDRGRIGIVIAPPIYGGYAYDYDDYDDDVYVGRRFSSRHVEWCSDRYRSYDPRSNTWVAYSGAVRQCNSPYN
jgi:BA14K-like protein